MYRFSYPHYKETTSNAVEVCNNVMKYCQGFPHSIREATFFCKYRQLIEWSFRRVVERKRLLYPAGIKVPVLGENSSPIFCPYAVSILMNEIHYYLNNRNMYEVISKYPNQQITDKRNHVFYVNDYICGEKYLVDLKYGECNCHYTHWKRIPCQHIMVVLFERREVQRAFEYVDKVYREDEVAKTCRELTDTEIGFIQRILNLKSNDADDVDDGQIGVPVYLDLKEGYKGAGKNSLRVPSTGEMIKSDEDTKKSRLKILQE